jgi:primosomal protein N' (replication factor Y)
VGTQIVTKGLDFDNVGLVGVLHADNMLNFPDFRSYERSYQLMSQVAGRSGRKDRRGKVVIQTSLPGHPVMQHILKNDYHAFYMSQMEDRKAFHYPPYQRLIRITLRHTSREMLDKASTDLAASLRSKLNKSDDNSSEVKPPSSLFATKQSSHAAEILGPQSPLIGRIHQQHLMTILVKLPRSFEILKSREIIGEATEKTRSDKRFGKLFIIPDVDPY